MQLLRGDMDFGRRLAVLCQDPQVAKMARHLSQLGAGEPNSERVLRRRRERGNIDLIMRVLEQEPPLGEMVLDLLGEWDKVVWSSGRWRLETTSGEENGAEGNLVPHSGLYDDANDSSDSDY